MRLSLFFFLASSSFALAQTAAPAPKMTKIKNEYTCKQAAETKFNKRKFDALSDERKILVDGTYLQCDFDRKRKRTKNSAKKQVIYFANPTPIEGTSKIFYGLIDPGSLENARRNCGTAGMAGGVALTIVGAATGNPLAGQAGSVLYEYSGVSCDGLADGIKKDSLLPFLAPTEVIGAAVRGKVIGTIIDNLPLISDADKDNLRGLAAPITTPPTVRVQPGQVEVSGPGYRIPIRSPFR